MRRTAPRYYTASQKGGGIYIDVLWADNDCESRCVTKKPGPSEIDYWQVASMSNSCWFSRNGKVSGRRINQTNSKPGGSKGVSPWILLTVLGCFPLPNGVPCDSLLDPGMCKVLGSDAREWSGDDCSTRCHQIFHQGWTTKALPIRHVSPIRSPDARSRGWRKCLFLLALFAVLFLAVAVGSHNLSMP